MNYGLKLLNNLWVTLMFLFGMLIGHASPDSRTILTNAVFFFIGTILGDLVGYLLSGRQEE